MNQQAIYPGIVVFIIAAILAACAAGCTGVETTDSTSSTLLPEDHDQTIAAYSALTASQVEIDQMLMSIDSEVAHSAYVIAGAGLTGEAASAEMQRLYGTSPHILSAAVFNEEPRIVTAFPDSPQIVGSSISFNPETLRVIKEGERQMSLVFLSAEEIPGSVVIMHPVFGSEGRIIGGVSALITPATAIPEVTKSHFTDTDLHLIVDQVDTTILYDSDPEQIGLSIDAELYTASPTLHTMVEKKRVNPTGTGIYEFVNQISGETTKKEIIWTTVGLHHTEWRVSVFWMIQ